MTSPIDQGEALAALAAVYGNLTPEQKGAWGCQVVRGEPSWVSDDSRVSVNQWKADPGEPTHITLGVYLGDHKWGMATFAPEQALIIAAMICERPACAAALRALREHIHSNMEGERG